MIIERYANKVIVVLGTGLTLFQVYTALYMPFPGMQQRALHLAFGLGMLFLVYPKSRSKNPRIKMISYIIDSVFALAGIIASLYAALNWGEMTEALRLTFPEPQDLILGTIVILLVIIGTKRITGWALPTIAIIFLLYAYYGNYIPIALFKHPGVKLTQIISMGYMCTEGIYSSLLGVSTNQVFVFLLFGQLLESLGGSDFFIDLSNSIFGKVRGGPAKVAIIASGLFGSISGSAVANVAGTGTITIPLMKKVGFKPRMAGAVEAVASTGGLIMPPVMGAAAFLMADIVGVTYWDVCKAAAIPAILYYRGLYVTVDLRARALNIHGLPPEEIPDRKKLLKSRAYIFLPPLAILVFFLAVMRYPADKSCIYCVIMLLALALTKKELRGALKKDWLQIMVKTAKSSLTVMMACACAGLVLLSFQVSGLSLKLSNILIQLSGGNMYLLLVLVMLGSLILGMGLPASACYILLAILGAPAIVSLGVPVIAAHLFVLYFGALSAITPPVAMAAYAAGPIAGESSSRIGYTAWKMSLPIYLIAFCFVLQPELVLIGSWYKIVSVALFCICGVVSIAIGNQGYFIQKVNPVRRIFWIISGIALILPGLYTSLPGLVIAMILLLTENGFLETLKSKVNKNSAYFKSNS